MHILKFMGFLNFLKKNKEKDLIIFGASTAGSALKHIITNAGYDVKFFSDNNAKLWGKTFEDVPVLPPTSLADLENKLILVASSYYSEIVNQLAGYGLKKYEDYYNAMNFEEVSFEKYQDDIELRDFVIKDIYSKIESGLTFEQAVKDIRAKSHGERICEYPFIMNWLINYNPKTILDCGSVLNNKIIDAYIPASTELNFLNPGLESVIRENTTYYKYDLANFKSEKKYDLVSCLSTLEHIGFDNSRYGFESYDLGWGWEESIASIKDSLVQLLNLVEDKGHLIVSVPYGKKEFVYLNNDIRSSQVVNIQHIEPIKNLLDSYNNIHYELVCMKLSENGWEKSFVDDDYSGYGEVGPGASGVLFISVNKL